MKFLLVISHLLALGMGYLLMPKSQPQDSASPESTPRTRVRARPLPASENPFLHANSDDYQALFREVIHLPEPRGPLDRLLVVWAKIDPEAALLAFAEYYDPINSDTVLSGLQNETGSLLAPFLVKHYGALKFVEPVDVRSALGRSLGTLAGEDLNAALALLEELPRGMPEEIYRNVIGELSGPQLQNLFAQIPFSPATRKLAESNEFWEQAINRAWRQLPPDDFNQLFLQLDHPAALKSLTRNIVKEAVRFNEHSALIQTLKSLSEEKLHHALATIKVYHLKSLLESPLFLEAIQDNNAADFLDRLKR